MDDENENILYQEEASTPMTKESDAIVSKLKNLLPHIKTMVENFDDKDIFWGIKQCGNKYKSVVINNEVYALNDCVRCRSGLELDYIGKIMKLSQENDQKVCTLRWFFRPFELPTSFKETYKGANTRELFLAFGEGIGVENKNLLVSCYKINKFRSFYNVENVVPLGVIVGKCRVLCMAKDDFNDLPSSEHLEMCDFFFSKAFDCDNLKIVGLDVVADAIGAQKVYNKKEWLNWNKNDMHSTSLTSSPVKVLCQSFCSYTFPTNSSDVNILPILHCNSSPSITEQSTKETFIEKRKRDSMEKVISSQKLIHKNKKIKLSPTSKNQKFSPPTILIKQEDQFTKSISEVKSVVTIVDALNTSSSTTRPIVCEESQLACNEIINTSFAKSKINGTSKSSMDLSINASMILKQTSSIGVEDNADDIHVTCEGFPIESFLEPLEKSESSTSKLKKDDNTSKLAIIENGRSEIRKACNSKKDSVNLTKEKKKTSKVIRKKRKEKPPNDIIDNMSKKIVKKNSNGSKRAQNKRKKVKKAESESQSLDTLHPHDPSKISEYLLKKHDLNCSIDQQSSLESHVNTTKPTTIEESLSKESLKSLPTNDNMTKKIISNNTISLEDNFESKCEDWDEQIQKAIAAKRVLLLSNVNSQLHSFELQDALSKFLETHCEVQKITPRSFYYNTTLALLKLMTPDVAQKSLQILCKECLMVGERTLIATLCEGLEFVKECYCFHGHICIQPKCEQLNDNCIEMDSFPNFPHVAEGNTIEFTFGLRWRLLQEQHELQWQLLNELHEKELSLLNKKTKINRRL